MGWKGRGGGRGRGGGAGRHASHDQGEGTGGRGRGGGGRGREKRSSGPGGTSQTGFIAGGALADWEGTTPDRSRSNNRRGRAYEGPDGGPRQQNYHGRGGSKREWMVRFTENSFTSVSFSYTQSRSRREEAIATSNTSIIAQPAMEDGAAASREMEVVVPATEGRVEVYMDRGRGQEALESLDLATRTTGLGFVDEDRPNRSSHVSDPENPASTSTAGINGSGDGNHMGAVEAIKVDTEQASYLELKTLGQGKNSRSSRTSKKGSRIGSASTSKKSSGFLSIGGVKVWTEQGVTDESEGLEEPDVCVALDFASGKTQWGPGSKHSNSKRKKKFQQASGAHQRGQWLEDSSSESEESIIDSSNSEIEDELAEDYLANLGVAAGSLDATWLLRDKLFEQVPVEDMAIQGWEDDRDTSTETSASESDSDLGRSGYASPEKMWSLRRQKKGKDLMETDNESDSELEDMAEKLLFEGDLADGSDVKGGRESGAALRLRDLELYDSPSGEEDSEDEDDINQLFELLEDANFMPDKSPITPATGKQLRSSIGKSIEPVTWPVCVHKTKKKSKRIPGEKKRERKETIAAKRKQRALGRGFDLQAINLALEDIVVRGTDIFAFAPMEDQDRAQIHRLAAVYRLKSGSQGSGKRRFTVVTRTRHTSLPTGADKYRLASMLGQGDASAMVHTSRPLTGEDRRMAKKINNAARQAFLSMQGPTPKKSGRKHQKLMQLEGSSEHPKSKKRSSGHGQSTMERSGGSKARTAKYANKPMSFISSGTIGNEQEMSSPGLGASISVTAEFQTSSVTDRGETSSSRSEVVKVKASALVPAAIGTFEAHTRGFGSRMMSKMGFVEGQGLGRDGQGIASPVEAIKRPKSLGLGAYAPPPAT